MEESESEVLKIEESESELLCTDSTALVFSLRRIYQIVPTSRLSDYISVIITSQLVQR
jgi:hypothetical protein